MSTRPSLQRVSKDTDPEKIVAIINEDGGVVIEGLLSDDQVRRFNAEIDPYLEKKVAGSKSQDEIMIKFHGSNTKRVANVVTRSQTFREEIIDDDAIHGIATAVFAKDAGAYWMGTAEVIEIGPGNPIQILHRDFGNYPHYARFGANGPEAMVNFLIATTDFTEENGATRVIPGSNKWENFGDLGKNEMTIPVEMKAGDALFFSGKVVHGGGANMTKDFYRRAISFNVICSFLAPEEAFPFLVPLEIVKTMSERAQTMIGFRSQLSSTAAGVWRFEYGQIADVIGV